MDKHPEVHDVLYDPTSDGSVSDDAVLGEKDGTARDVRDMSRLGKEQVLRRNFGFLSIFGFSMILMSTWETQLTTAAFGLVNGGSAGAIYVYIGCFFGLGAAIFSMAEMASMAPTAGGQYHWVSEFAPKSKQKLMSYFVGWLCVLGWQAGSAAACYVVGTEIQGLIILNIESYTPHPWHGTLIGIALVLLNTLFNTFLVRKLPLIEGLALILHVFGFFAIVIPLWVYGDRAPAKDVFTSFNDGGNWGSTGLASLVGLLSPTLALLGSDAAVHMSEELRNASKTLPRTMLSTLFINGALGFIALVTFCFMIGDLETVLSTPTGFPFIQVFYNATQSYGGASAMSSIMLTLTYLSGLTNMATASRQLWSFARDQGVPFHSFFGKVPPGWDIPLNAVFATTVGSILLVCISFGSTTAFNQLTALSTVALLSSYVGSVGSMFWRRATNQRLLPAYWSMGRIGIVANGLGVGFLLLATIFCFFPPQTHPTVKTMNWVCVIYTGVLGIAYGYYILFARHKYVGPVEYVRKLD